jgi:hypothetical protein
VRNPNQVLGDLHALVAANEIGTRRLVEFMAEYGLGDLAALAEMVQGKAESAMRAALRFAARACRSTCSPRAHMTVNLDRLIFFDCFSKQAHLGRPSRANPLDPSADQGSVDRQDHWRESCVSRHARAGPLARRAVPARVRARTRDGGEVSAFHEQACKLELEGIVSKRADAAYAPGEAHFPTGIARAHARGEEFAAGVFVSLDHLTLVDLLASCGIMRPKRDPGWRWGSRVHQGWHRRRGAAVPMAQNPAALHPDRTKRPRPYRPARVATPGASEWISRVSSPATNKSGRTRKAQETPPTRARHCKSP